MGGTHQPRRAADSVGQRRPHGWGQPGWAWGHARQPSAYIPLPLEGSRKVCWNQYTVCLRPARVSSGGGGGEW